MKTVQLRKTTLIDVQAAQITALNATLDDGSQVALSAPAVVGDWLITNEAGEVSILTDADFQAEALVS